MEPMRTTEVNEYRPFGHGVCDTTAGVGESNRRSIKGAGQDYETPSISAGRP